MLQTILSRLSYSMILLFTFFVMAEFSSANVPANRTHFPAILIDDDDDKGKRGKDKDQGKKGKEHKDRARGRQDDSDRESRRQQASSDRNARRQHGRATANRTGNSAPAIKTHVDNNN